MTERGSARLREAWNQKGFQLDDEAVREIADQLSESPVEVETVEFHGGAVPTGVSVGLRYANDDVPFCGNDMAFWLKWHLRHGVPIVRKPRWIINGQPRPDLLKIKLEFGAGLPGGFDEI